MLSVYVEPVGPADSIQACLVVDAKDAPEQVAGAFRSSHIA